MHFARFSRLRNEALRGVKQLEQQKPPNEDHEAQESFPSQFAHTPRSCKNDCPNQTTSPQGRTKWMLARMVAIPSQTALLPVRKRICAGACLEFAKHTQPPIPPILRTSQQNLFPGPRMDESNTLNPHWIGPLLLFRLPGYAHKSQRCHTLNGSLGCCTRPKPSHPQAPAMCTNLRQGFPMKRNLRHGSGGEPHR